MHACSFYKLSVVEHPSPAQLSQQKYDLITYCITYKVSNERRQHCQGQRCYSNDKPNNVSCNIVVPGLTLSTVVIGLQWAALVCTFFDYYREDTELQLR